MTINKWEVGNYLDDNAMQYSRYTIEDRAIVSVLDGCKPIHRRILWSMYQDKLTHNNRRTKSVNASGSVLRYSPHGDSSVYSAMVRLANDSVLNPFIDGKGSFGTITSNIIQEASSRYTEVRLSPITQELLKNIDKGNVSMVDNYDDTRLEPTVLPSTFPAVLANPSLGIAVGLASKICSFNLEDICNNTIKALNNEDMDIMIPDFPTGAKIIKDKAVLKNIHENGKGSIQLQSTYHFEDDSIVITEIPYLVTREEIIDKIIELVKLGKVKEVVDINDFSGSDGLNITIECKKNTDKDMLIHKLFTLTSLQKSYGCNFNVLHNGKPKVMGVKDIINTWIDFRRETIKREVGYDIKHKENRLNILLGLEKILLDIDKAVNIIRFSDDPKLELIKEFGVNEEQACYILDVRLKNINKTYIQKQIKDISDLRLEVQFLKENIDNLSYIDNIIKSDLERVKKQYSQPRRTQLIEDVINFDKEEIIEDYNCRIVYSKNYIKKHLKQSKAHKMKDGEEILEDIATTNKSTLLIFTDKANRYRVPIHKLDVKQPSNIGDYVKAMIDMDKDESIIKIVSVESVKGYMLFCYDNGKISKIDIKSYMSNNTKLTNCFSLDSNIISMDYISKDVNVLLVSTEGRSLVVNTSYFNPKSTRSSQGNVGIKLDNGLKCVAAIINCKNETVKLTAANNKGRQISLDDKYDDNRTWIEYLSGKNGNKGNFVLNCRNINSNIVNVEIV